jgi:hypothetical protein
MVNIQSALLQQLLNIAQRERIAKIPPDRTEYEGGFGQPPFEDRGWGFRLAILSRHQSPTLKVATHPEMMRISAKAAMIALRAAEDIGVHSDV